MGKNKMITSFVNENKKNILKLIPVFLYVLLINQIVMAAGRPVTIPALREWTDGSATYTFGSSSRIVLDQSYSSKLEADAQIFQGELKVLTGLDIPVVNDSQASAGDIFISAGSSDKALGPEGYSLEITNQIKINALNDTGAFYGTRTVLQLLKQGFTIAGGIARDWPSYKVRGLMVDNGRKFYTYAWLKNHIMELAYLKMNYFHFHFSDNEGFRIESTKHPEIVSAAHLTKAEIISLQEIAAKYHVMIVPEIDMPGHMYQILSAHTDLRLKNSTSVATGNIDLSKEESYTLMKDIIEEYMPLFTSKYWHIGSDEYLNPSDYANYPQLLTYAKKNYGSTAVAKDIFLGFINWANKIVKGGGKTLQVWNDALTNSDGGGYAVKLDKDIVVDFWSGGTAPQSLVNAGYSVINSNSTLFYYVLGAAWKPKASEIYESWSPEIFQGSRSISANSSKNLGGQLLIWCDYPNAETEAQVAEGIRIPLRTLAQRIWGSDKLVSTYISFKSIIKTIGRAPGVDYPVAVNTAEDSTKNLAYGKTVKCSGVEPTTSFYGNYVTDGDYSTRWASDYSDNAWMYIDLGKQCNIDAVKITWEAAYGNKYDIQVSDNASKWTTVKSVDDGNGGVDSLGSLNAKGRYIKFQGRQRITEWGFSMYEFEVSGSPATIVKPEDNTLPIKNDLSQNYPNPFNPATTIKYSLEKSGQVLIKVYNLLGQEIATLINKEQAAGAHSVPFVAGSIPSGIYIYKISTGTYSDMKKMLLLK
jgi:hexosaminidase